MKHYIIVKWKDPAVMAGKAGEIQELFNDTLSIERINAVTVHPSCSDRSNRHDLMIEMDMDPAALPAYDACTPHKEWKKNYGEFILQKTIFDCE